MGNCRQILKILLYTSLILFANTAAANTVRVATVHFAPELRDVEANRSQLIQLTEQAAEGGAKIVVHTEMATAGYSYFSRHEIEKVAETIPGETTLALGAVAAKHRIYVVVGMPEYSSDTNSFYNSAVLIGPDGLVVGTYRKRNNLLEASYNSAVYREVPTFDTPYGRLSIVICADMFYPHFPRAAAVAGTQILLAPANVGITEEFMRVRTFENGFAMIVANRYGTGEKGEKGDYFNQDTFTIPSPFVYSFSDSQSVIMDAEGNVLAQIAGEATKIAFADLPLGPKQPFPVVRKPFMYSLIGQDTLEPYVRSQLGLPDAGRFLAAAIDPGPTEDPAGKAIEEIEAADRHTEAGGNELRLVVLPEAYLKEAGSETVAKFRELSRRRNVDIVLSSVDDGVPVSVLIVPDGRAYPYRRTHKRRGSNILDAALSNEFLVVDRPYGRVGISHGADMLAPETAVVFAKMGVDVIAVSADDDLAVLDSLWRVRTGNYVHVIVANRRGQEGIFLGGYKAFPSQATGEGTLVMELDTSHVREKKFPRFFHYRSLLERCGELNC